MRGRQIKDGIVDEVDWLTYGPDDTAEPEPTQHALEKSEVLMARYGRTSQFFHVPDRLKDAPPGHYVVEADEMLHDQNGRIISGETADSLERQAERLLERARIVREKYERFGEDDFPAGAVIIFDKRFNEYGGRLIPWSKPYHYAALKDPNGLWNTTGPKSPKAYSWAELVRWMGDGVEEIFYVSELTKFVG